MEEQRKKKISELEEIAVEIIQPEKQRENQQRRNREPQAPVGL